MPRSHGQVPAHRSRTPRWGFAVVVGTSMEPGLRSGDRLLVDYRRPPAAGDLVVARVPGRPRVVKRAVARRTTDLGEPGWWLLSDAPDRGSDSRRFGAVPDGDVLAVVVMRAWPPWPRRAVGNSPGA